MTSIVVREGNTIYDLILQTYGFDYAIRLVQENGIDSINSTLTSGQIITYDETFQVPKVPDVAQLAAAPGSSIKSITGRSGQSLYDLALMTYGSFDNIIKLIQDSNIDSLNETDLFQKSVTYDENLIVDKLYYTKVIKTGTVINTSIDTSVRVLGVEDGGAYFGTEDGFLVEIE